MQSISGGKALDIFADLFQVTNVNNIANSDPSKVSDAFLICSSFPGIG